MILILSNYWDYSTSNLIRSLKYKKITDFKIITTADIINKKLLITIGGELSIDEEVFDFENVKVVWNRRFSSLGYTDYYDSIIQEKYREYEFDAMKLSFQLRNEFNTVIEYINFRLYDKIWYPGYNLGNINKLIVLDQARKCGLEIPLSYILNYKNCQFDDFISKSAFELAFFQSKDNGMMNMFTRYVDLKDKNIPDIFFPSLIQQYIVKKIELRTFFIDRSFFTMAIFSQKDENTLTDFRASWSFKNRWVKYQLPEDILEKLRLLMSSLKLRTGSIDMILTNDNKYIFLEVNPVGQYGMTSVPCNYNLDDVIANTLIKNNE